MASSTAADGGLDDQGCLSDNDPGESSADAWRRVYRYPASDVSQRPSVSTGKSYELLGQARLTSQRRMTTIIFLLTPMALTTSTVTNNIRGENSRPTGLSKFRDRLANWLESPVGQSLAELNTIAFLYGGRYLEVGRRLTGLSYVSIPDLGRGSS
jgi:hypothetical protein